jgi:osmotically-inducible protein OsmY
MKARRAANGDASWTGAVHSWAERKSVLAAARFTRGVHAIVDHLRMEPVRA